jgi:predicted nuclease of predicted toxin-antitoxin system
MKFLIDAQLPPGLARLLVSSGHSAEHVFETGGLGAKNEDIWTYAKQTGSTIITKDEDFAVKVCMRAEGPAVVWVRICNSIKHFLITWFSPLLPKVIEALNRGERLVELT